jgi:hypothetical protein
MNYKQLKSLQKKLKENPLNILGMAKVHQSFQKLFYKIDFGEQKFKSILLIKAILMQQINY